MCTGFYVNRSFQLLYVNAKELLVNSSEGFLSFVFKYVKYMFKYCLKEERSKGKERGSGVEWDPLYCVVSHLLSPSVSS